MTTNNKYDVGQMLTDIHLEIYHPLFQTSDYSTISDCTQLNNERLQAMGISLTGHRKRILTKLQELLGKVHSTPEDITVDTAKTSNDRSLEHDKKLALFGQGLASVLETALTDDSSKNCTHSLTDCLTMDESVSAQSKHKDQDMFSEHSEISGYDTALDFRERTDLESSSFFEFQGPMVENDLYGTRSEEKVQKTQAKKVPSRSFILRNRPVPDLPVSVSNTSYSRHSGEIMTSTNPIGDFTINLENKQSGDENSNPISPYEETFFFSNSESTKEATSDISSVVCSDGTGSSESLLQNSQCKPPPNAMSSATNGGSEESIYSTLEESTHDVGTKPAEDLRSQSLLDSHSQSDTISSHSSESGFQEEFSITPYASFYAPCTMTSKVGWLDKLSPHSACMFQKRWVKFDGHHISYYHNDRDVFSRGKVLLSAVIKIKKLGDNKFEIVTSQRTYVFRAEKEVLRHEWLAVLEEAVKKQASKSAIINDGDKSGYLELKGYKNKIFTVIDGSKTWLSKSKQEYNAGIVITDITMTMTTLKNADRKSFEVTTPFRNFCFTADSEREKQDWIETLEQSIAETVADFEVAEKIWFNESNRSCADCRASNPDCASINLGVVICRSCAGQHRALGSKISKVHSLKLNTSMWTNELVELFIVLGNEKVNSFWEANLLPENTLPVTSSINQRRLFVTQKYKEGRFKNIRSPDLSPQQLNEALCAAVTKADVLETMILVFSGADVMCTTGDSVHSTPYLLAKMAGQRLQMEFLHHNRLSDYQTTDSQTVKNQNLFYCGFLYKTSSSSSKLSASRKIQEDMTKWWCTIENSLLNYYEDENNTVPEGSIDLSEVVCLVVHPSDFILGSGAIFTFEIYVLSERMFLFGAENAESQREWAKALSKNFVPTGNESLVELDFDVLGFLYYKDSYTLMEWKEGWFALEKNSLHYSHRQENFQRETIQLKKLQELTKTSSVENGEKINILLLVENGRTLYVHGHTVLDFMVWHCAIEKAAGTDGNALQDQQLCKNNIPIIVNSCMAFVTQYGLGSTSLYLKSGNPLKVRELLEDFKKDARSIKLKVGEHQLEDVTDVLKYFLYEIDDALLTKELYPYWISALDIQDEQERVLKYKNLIDTLPTLNKTTLAALIEHLYRIQKCSDVNQLETHVLAPIFSSCLFQTKGHHNEELHVVEELIKFYAEIFDISEVQLKQMDIENRFITKWNDTQVPIPQTGDLLLDVYLERKDPNMCVIIKVSSTLTAAELTSCVAGIKNITLSNEMFWTAFEVFENGELERPMHFKENVLETVLGWSMLPDPGSAYLLVKPFITVEHLKHCLPRISKSTLKSGNMKYKEDSSKLLSGNKFQERYFVLRERKLLIYKDIKSIKPEKVLPVVVCKFFLGVKKKMKPPTRFGLTACFEKHQWHLCCDTQKAQMEWIISILNAQCAGEFLPRRKTEQMLTVKSLQMRGLHGNKLKDTTEIQPMPMSEKTRRKVRPAISKKELTNAVQQRMSMIAEVFDNKEERLMSQKKHYSLVDLDSPENYSGDTKELDTIDVKRLHNPTDQLNKKLSANVQLPQNVIKELNLVLRKSRKDQNECV
ncbi:PREDICTED: arf-GAP with Rho-GAP domain, ANK repeat and PH domain-containing protein 2 [Nanorana parkeri]|uniref:arf-GAP with Rho-GAP domain, ANK repeat and PH domain-containing protein 2 n=1 Tax=Nanorana parkeri TaxID=125878 RepID=UPI000853F0DF|nr:PREDICTED: arf-GAP with Rho-GAP domain, ANK repeat and PH domain-containing protein 2 [Nanorana parkeri]